MKDTDWLSDLHIKPLPGASFTKSLKAVDKTIVMGNAMEGNLLKAAAEVHHKAIGSMMRRADVRSRLRGRQRGIGPRGRVRANVQGHGRIQRLGRDPERSCPPKLCSTVNPLDAQAAAKAFYEFNDAAKAAQR